jgi:hypothetical protein
MMTQVKPSDGWWFTLVVTLALPGKGRRLVVLLHIGWSLLQIAIPVDDADDAVRCTMKSTILWPLVVGAVVALILVITAVSMSASGFRLDVERWVLIGAFLVVISMAAAAVVSALNALKEVRERSTGDDSTSNTSRGSS